MRPLPENDLVLLGLGHTNAHILRMWRMEPWPGVRLTCVTDRAVATYSGLLPGVLAGQYPEERMQIDLVRLSAAAGARLVVADVNGLDPDGRNLQFASRPPLAFDVLSIGIGSVPAFSGVTIKDDSCLVAVKPMQTFLARLDAALATLSGRDPARVAVVGGGAGGVEVASCLPAHLERMSLHAGLANDAGSQVTMISDGRLLPGSLARTAERARRVFTRRGTRIIEGRRVVEVDAGRLRLDDESVVEADVVIWVAGAAPPPLLAKLGLPTDDRGFLLTDATLQSTSGAPIFVVGDSGTLEHAPPPKAGVYAVRQGPVLRENVRRVLDGQPLRAFVPQQGFLKLLNTGDGSAIGEWRGLSFEGRWAWRLKDAIDRRFLDKHQDYTPMEMTTSTADAPSDADMRCLGCGGKVDGSVLSRVLARLDVPASEHVMVGLDQPDDAAVVRAPGGRPVTVTVDFFSAPFDDPYLIGRLSALNAMSDVFAVGATPWAALALVTLPVGRSRQQEELLYQLLAGGLEELRNAGATLVGGHTIEGPQVTIGFTVLASQTADPPLTKGRLRPGDALVLTKALGTGVLLAAHMRARCRAEWFEPLLGSMLIGNGPAAIAAADVGIGGLTDVTGFGLAGHLLEMLKASDVAADLRLGAIPLLPGAHRLISEGVESTMAAANRHTEVEMEGGDPRAAAYQALFDPQTGGGLLMGVPPSAAEALLSRLRELGCRDACVIGDVVASTSGRRRIRLS